MPGLVPGIHVLLPFLSCQPKTWMGRARPAMTRRRHMIPPASEPVSLPMNYRHAFHAGGFADVIKHIVLVRMLAYLQDKQAAFRVVDTHAGAGVYDLAGEEARRGGEWLTGIALIMQARFSEKNLPLLKPYLDIVRAFNPQSPVKTYPGSPLIARALLRPQDRLTACRGGPEGAK